MFVLAMLGTTAAHAYPRGPGPGDGPVGRESFTVSLGTNSAFDGDPATFRLTVEGEGDLTRGPDLRLAVAVPVTWMTSGEDRFGVSFASSVFEIPPTLRLRLFPRLAVRPYGDLGLGVAIASTTTDSWLFSDQTNTAGWMTRTALGVDIGDPRGLYVKIEPISMNTYHLGGNSTRVGAMVGVGSRF